MVMGISGEIDGLIFDVDGTLWDSTQEIANAWNSILEKERDLNIRISADFLKSVLGMTPDEIGEKLIVKSSIERRKHLIVRCMEIQDTYLKKHPPKPYEGLEEALKVLCSYCPLFIVSNCQAGYVERFLDATGYGHYFTGHLCIGDTGKYKADNIRKIVDDYQLKNATYVGDIENDCIASREAGVHFIHAAYGFGKVLKPDYTIQSLWELPELIQRIS